MEGCSILARISVRCLKVLSPFWNTLLRCCDSSPTHNRSNLRSIQAITMAATSPIDSVWSQTTTRLCRLFSHRPGVVSSCQLIVASPLVVPSLRRSLVVLLHQLVVASPLAVLSLRCPLVVLSRQLVVALPLVILSMRHPLVNSSCQLVAASYRITSPHPLVAHRTALSSSRHAGWLLRRLSACSPLVILSSRCAASRCLVAPAGRRAIISCRPLVAPPSHPLIVLAGLHRPLVLSS